MTVPEWAINRARAVYNQARDEVERDCRQPGVVVGPSNYQWIIAEALAVAHREGWEAMREAAASLVESHVESQNNNPTGSHLYVTPKMPAHAAGIITGTGYANAIRAIPYPDPVEKEQP